MSNMPTAFLESFKKLESFKNEIPGIAELGESDEYITDYDGYNQSLYKPISALMPPKAFNSYNPYNKVSYFFIEPY